MPTRFVQQLVRVFKSLMVRLASNRYLSIDAGLNQHQPDVSAEPPRALGAVRSCYRLVSMPKPALGCGGAAWQAAPEVEVSDVEFALRALDARRDDFKVVLGALDARRGHFKVDRRGRDAPLNDFQVSETAVDPHRADFRSVLSTIDRRRVDFRIGGPTIDLPRA